MWIAWIPHCLATLRPTRGILALAESEQGSDYRTGQDRGYAHEASGFDSGHHHAHGSTGRNTEELLHHFGDRAVWIRGDHAATRRCAVGTFTCAHFLDVGRAVFASGAALPCTLRCGPAPQ